MLPGKKVVKGVDVTRSFNVGVATGGRLAPQRSAAELCMLGTLEHYSENMAVR
jgi:hypothetical protein